MYHGSKDETRHRERTRTRLAAWALAAAIACAPLAASATGSDPWITTKVKLSLIASPDVDGGGVNVDTVDGRVTLQGEVGSPAEKARAEQIAGGIEGVRGVHNLLTVAPDKQRAAAERVDDDTLKQRVESALAEDRALQGSEIEVKSVEQGRVVLGGSAPTLSDRLHALQRVRDVAGVRAVSDRIESPSQMSDAEISRKDGMRGDLTQAARDMWITTDIKMRLMASDRVPALDVNVDTRDGAVTLFGAVPNAEARLAAVAEARKVEGVKSVEDQLQVVAPSRKEDVERDDAKIASAIEQRLDQRPNLKQADVGVEVHAGVARLKGQVRSEAERMEALTVARGVPGVRSVLDELRTESPSAGSESPRG
jgi:hyperosmotically inducible protein